MTHGKRENEAESKGEKRLDLNGRLALSISEAAEALGVSEGLFRQLLPEIPRVHLGRRIVIPVALLEEWLRERAKAEPGRIGAVVDDVLRSVREGR